MWMAISVSWATVLGDAAGYQAARDIMNNLVSYTRQTYPGLQSSNFRAGLADEGNKPPIFINDAMADQQVLQGYELQRMSC